MRASDFAHTQLGGPGVIADGLTKFIVCYLDEAYIDASMKDLVAYGESGKFAAFRAKCTHLDCTTLWRTEQEAKLIVPVDEGHDLIVCPCHDATYDPYASGKVRFGPAPNPLVQVPLAIEDGLVKVRLPAP